MISSRLNRFWAEQTKLIKGKHIHNCRADASDESPLVSHFQIAFSSIQHASICTSLCFIASHPDELYSQSKGCLLPPFL
jgi:hypothetical protein